MDQDEQRDSAEERYNADLCPECGESPCAGGRGKGSCVPDPYPGRDTYADISREAYDTAIDHLAIKLRRAADHLVRSSHPHTEPPDHHDGMGRYLQAAYQSLGDLGADLGNLRAHELVIIAAQADAAERKEGRQ